MSTMPESVTEEQFRDYILPNLTIARRGYVSKTPLWGIFNLILYRLHSGCQWDRLPVAREAGEREKRNEPSWQAVYDHWHNGVPMAVWNGFGKRVLDTFGMN